MIYYYINYQHTDYFRIDNVLESRYTNETLFIFRTV